MEEGTRVRPDDGAQFFRVHLLRKSEAVRVQEGGKVLPVPLKSRRTGAGRVQEKVLADLYPI